MSVLTETRKATAIFKSRDYLTRRSLEIMLLGSHARGFNMQLSHLNAIISEWPVSNGTRHEAQRIYPAARVASTVGRSSSFAEGAWRRSKEGPLRYCIPVLQLCIPVLHLNTVDILLSSLFYFAILVLIDDPQGRPPATPKQEPRDANSSKQNSLPNVAEPYLILQRCVSTALYSQPFFVVSKISPSLPLSTSCYQVFPAWLSSS